MKIKTMLSAAALSVVLMSPMAAMAAACDNSTVTLTNNSSQTIDYDFNNQIKGYVISGNGSGEISPGNSASVIFNTDDSDVSGTITTTVAGNEDAGKAILSYFFEDKNWGFTCEVESGDMKVLSDFNDVVTTTSAAHENSGGTEEEGVFTFID